MADSQPQHLESLQQRRGLATAEATGSNVVWAREEREDKACKDMVSVLMHHETQERVSKHEVESCETVTASAVSTCSCSGAVPAATLQGSSNTPGRCSVAWTPGASRLLLLSLERPQRSCGPHKGHSSDQAWFAEGGMSWMFSAASV